MTKQIKETKEIFGTLHTQFGEYCLLSPQPNKHDVPWFLRDYNVLSFFVADGYGIAKNILVGCPFVIEPATQKKFVEVTFFVDEEESVPVETNVLATTD